MPVNSNISLTTLEPGACVSREVRPQKQKRELGSPRATRRGGDNRSQLSAGCSFEPSQENNLSQDGNMQGSGGKEKRMCNGSVCLFVYLADSTLSFSCEPAGHRAAAHSRPYLHLLSESASRLPAFQLYTRLRLTPGATSAPGPCAGSPPTPCASRPLVKHAPSPPASASSARLVENNCRLVQMIICKVWEAHKGTDTQLALASGGSFQPRLMLLPSARSARLSR